MEFIGVPDPVGQDGKVLFSDGTNQPIWRYVTSLDIKDFAVLTFNSVSGAQVEVGTNLVNPAFTATYDGTPSSGTLTNTDNGESKNISGNLVNFNSDQSYLKTTNNDVVTFSIAVSDGSNNDTANRQVAWRPNIWAGVGPGSGTVDQTFIEALPLLGLRASRITTFSPTVGAAQRAWWAAPLSYGVPTFQVGIFAGGFVQEPNVNVTRNAVLQIYQVWKSVEENIGTNTVQVT